ncbi:hypothetical protein EST38_g9448 [Candolleomyces aberdarensis]|uniref:Uncharacterized protein n=1 Tax=Candolleomyces aberdarensis TaxID=2316362 RepID=A0A4Q2DAK9_9AGAR|nr:hypothetical protein EST38_g9448 [Candolleomyces aberdarensis]
MSTTPRFENLQYTEKTQNGTGLTVLRNVSPTPLEVFHILATCVNLEIAGFVCPRLGKDPKFSRNPCDFVEGSLIQESPAWFSERRYQKEPFEIISECASTLISLTLDHACITRERLVGHLTELVQLCTLCVCYSEKSDIKFRHERGGVFISAVLWALTLIQDFPGVINTSSPTSTGSRVLRPSLTELESNTLNVNSGKTSACDCPVFDREPVREFASSGRHAQLARLENVVELTKFRIQYELKERLGLVAVAYTTRLSFSMEKKGEGGQEAEKKGQEEREVQERNEEVEEVVEEENAHQEDQAEEEKWECDCTELSNTSLNSGSSESKSEVTTAEHENTIPDIDI